MILRVAVLFGLLAVLARLSRGTVWIAFIVTALAAGPVLGLGWHESAGTLLGSALSLPTLRLLLFVESIILLSGLMRRTGSLDRLGEAVRSALGSARGGVAVLPALVGLLPMPGGALFSAPLVDAAASGSAINPTRRAVANYWFRHTWEFWWPLYPGIIAAVELSGIPWSAWTVRMFLVTPVAALLGWAFILGRSGDDGVSRGGTGLRTLLREMAPILLIPALAAVSHGVSSLWPRWHPDGTWLLLACVWASMGVVLLQGRARPLEVLRSLNLRMVSMGVLILALMAYKGVIVDSGMAEELQREFSKARLPAVPIASAVACVGGLVTGIAVGFVGSTFPIVTSLLTASSLEFECAIGIAFLWGWVGMMLSPLHLCLLVTREHFRADWMKMYGLLGPLTVLTATIGTIGLATFGRSGNGHAPPPEPLAMAATIRKGGVDRITLAHLGSRQRMIRGAARQQRWPSFSPDGEHLAFAEGDRLWNLTVLSAGGHRVAVAESLVGDRICYAWSSDGRHLAASCVTLEWGRCLLRWKEGSARSEVVPSTLGALCPFWREDTLGFFMPGPQGWALARSVPGSGRIGWWELPALDPTESSISPDGATLAYLAAERAEQPPRVRGLTVDLTDGTVRNVGGVDEEVTSLAWDGDDLLCLMVSGSTRCLTRINRQGEQSLITTIEERLVGVEIVPGARVVAGICRRAKGMGWELVVRTWEGSVLRRMAARGADYWGISVVSPAPKEEA